MSTIHERVQQKLAEIAEKKAEREIEAAFVQHDGISCGEWRPNVNGLTGTQHREPFFSINAVPNDSLSYSFDSAVRRDWFERQLQVLGQGDTFFISLTNRRNLWCCLFSKGGLEGLLSLALALEGREDASFYNPRTGESLYLNMAEYETKCFYRYIGPLER